jgi:aspartyl aminopeptidase
MLQHFLLALQTDKHFKMRKIMHEHQFNQDFFRYLEASPTPFHAVAFMAGKLQDSGFIELSETAPWKLEPGNSYFVTRDNGALAAFTLASEKNRKQGFRIMGAHTDSPSLKIKPLAAKASHSYFQLGVEVYGGPLLSTWFDRDLSIAGLVVCTTADNHLATLLIDFKRPLVVIPSLAIHLDREANNGRAINKQKELAPIICQIPGNEPLTPMNETSAFHNSFSCKKNNITSCKALNFSSILAEQIQREHPECKAAAIMGYDLFCHDSQPPSFLGANNEFICSGRLDNLLSCFTGYTAMIETRTQKTATGNSLLICNNHEEVGSLTAEGAKGTFLQSILQRIIPDPDSRQRILRQSFFISMDSAHGVHPNFSDKSDPEHLPLLNHGPVIKSNASQNYATTGISAAIYKTIAAEAGVPTQDFVMRSDMGCGSTIGPHTAATLGIPTVDIGTPTLAMHSIREMTGSRDPYLLYRTIHHFLSREHLPRIQG